MRGHRLYKAALERCRAEFGLRYLQPGRFLTMGARNDAPFLWFFPADNLPSDPPRKLHRRPAAGNGSMRTRPKSARASSTRISAHFDRQIVLVDTLGALHAGRTAFEDTEHAIGDIAACLAASDSILPRLLGGSGIERVAFVATKADHVPELHRDNLRALMREMVRLAREHGPRCGLVPRRRRGRFDNRRVGGPARRSSRTGGVGPETGGDAKRGAYRVGNVPIAHPPDSFWSGRYFELPSFTPPPIDPNAANGIPHLGLDQILVDLIGDRL